MTGRETDERSALTFVEANRSVDRSPRGMADLEARAMAAASVEPTAIDGVVAGFRSRLADIDSSLDATSTLADLRDKADPVLSGRARLIRGVAGFLMLLVPVLALGCLISRRPIPLDAGLHISAVLMAIAAVIAGTMAVIALSAVRYVRFGTNYLIGTAVVAVIVAIAAVGLSTAAPQAAGNGAGGQVSVIVIAAIVVAASSMLILVRARARQREINSATDDMEPTVKRITDALDAARTETIEKLGELPSDLASHAALDDRNGAVELLLKRYQLTKADATSLLAMPLGAFQLMPDYLAITNGTDG